jgi:MFS family permease
MTTHAIVAIGVGQCVNWGVLYYAFGILLTPLELDLQVPTWIVASAFSLALLTSALTAPTVGKWIDRGLGLRSVLLGGYVAASVLLLWTVLPGLPSLFVVWAALGVCMAFTLYEPVFVTIGRVIRPPAARLRALATVTVFGGLASTVFLPLTALLVEAWDWRSAVAVLATTLAVSTFVCAKVHGPQGGAMALPDTLSTPQSPPVHLRPLLGLFGAASLATTAFTTTLVPALVSHDVTPLASAWLGGLVGVMQLPGRLLLMCGSLQSSASRLLVVSLTMQAAGIAIIAIAIDRPPLVLAVGVTIFAIGAGVMTLARPHLVQTVFAIEQGGYVNGKLAGAQNVARAGGPVLAVGLASVIGYGPTFGVLAALIAAIAVVCPWVIDVSA